MLIRITEEEALTAALAAEGAEPGSDFAVTLRSGCTQDVFRNHQVCPGAVAAVCVYLAVRSGAFVMREETRGERGEREDAQAAACFA